MPEELEFLQDGEAFIVLLYPIAIVVGVEIAE